MTNIVAIVCRSEYFKNSIYQFTSGGFGFRSASGQTSPTGSIVIKSTTDKLMETTVSWIGKDRRLIVFRAMALQKF